MSKDSFYIQRKTAFTIYYIVFNRLDGGTKMRIREGGGAKGRTV